MASDEDARAAARRIVEEVLAERGVPGPGAHGTRPTTDAAEASSEDTHDPAEATADPGGNDAADERADTLVAHAVDDLIADPDVEVPGPDVSDARARARALVAEVLADHAARAEASGGTSPTDAASSADAEAAAEDAPPVPTAPGTAPEPGPPESGPPDAGSSEATSPEPGPPETTSRLRARELVAAAIAEAEARQAVVAADERAREQAEADAAEAREREADAAAQLAAAVAEEAEETERELWADADRQAASATAPLPMGEAPPHDPAAETTPMTVAELAADERAARTVDPDPDPDRDADPDLDAEPSPERTAVMPVAASTTIVRPDPTDDVTETHEVRQEADVVATAAVPATDPPPSTEPDTSARPAVDPDAPPVLGAVDVEPTTDLPALEATVELGDVSDPPRTGRWLLASIVGAVTLAVLFPLAIQALVRLVSMS